jgi:hypothetical protein
MAVEEFIDFASPQSGRPDTKAAPRRGEAVTKVRKDAEAKARDEAAAVAQEHAAAKAKAEAEANLRPPLLFVLPKISLTDCFRATPNRLLEEAARALYISFPSHCMGSAKWAAATRHTNIHRSIRCHHCSEQHQLARLLHSSQPCGTSPVLRC